MATGTTLRIPPPPARKNALGSIVIPSSGPLPAIPTTITHLELTGHDFKQRVTIPEGIRWVNLSESASEGGFGFPASLETLIWRDSNCALYSGRFSHLPNLTQLDLSWREMESLPDLPPTLVVLKLENCKYLTRLPRLPEGLRVLDIRGCRNLKTLPDIPDSVEELWCAGCDKLRPRRIVEDAFNYWDMPVWFRMHQQKEAMTRVQKRTRALRQEIVAAAYHPKRVERWLEQRGWDILEEMMG
jgi:hypothetical protein